MLNFVARTGNDAGTISYWSFEKAHRTCDESVYETILPCQFAIRTYFSSILCAYILVLNTNIKTNTPAAQNLICEAES